MRAALSVARRELSRSFASPLAWLFLAGALSVIFIRFFGEGAFFARGRADLRPLFDGLPLFFVFLCPALSMRHWAEESRQGTLPLLLSLPVSRGALVFGKWLASWMLVAAALCLTAALPLTVARIGPLELGPVIGGYLGALLLAGLYLSIGAIASALTDNPLTAWLLGALGCALSYLIGADWIAASLSVPQAELLAKLGSESRYQHMLRGVLRATDLLYFIGITGLALALTATSVSEKGAGESGRRRRLSHRLRLLLVGLNLLLFGFGLNRLHLSADLTADGRYSASPALNAQLAALSQPLSLRGYFSAHSHPLLTPLIPEIEDLLRELAAGAGGAVQLELFDPSDDLRLQEQAEERDGVRAVPFTRVTRDEQGVVNAYFSIVIGYGDASEQLTVADLVQATRGPSGGAEVGLKDIKRAIAARVEKLRAGLAARAELFTQLPMDTQLKAKLPAPLPPGYRRLPRRLESLQARLRAASGGRLELQIESGASEPSEPSFEVEAGDLKERLAIAPGQSEAELFEALKAALSRAVPGALPAIGLVSPKRSLGPRQLDLGAMLRRWLGRRYALSAPELKAPLPDKLRLLILLEPDLKDPSARAAVDQLLMRGGAVILLSGRYALDPKPGAPLALKETASGVDALMSAYGLFTQPGLALSEDNRALILPVRRQLRPGVTVDRLEKLPYPPLIQLPPAALKDSPADLGDLYGLTLGWASAIEGGEALITAPEAWVEDPPPIAPDFDRYPRRGFAPPPAAREPLPLAVELRGPFPSAISQAKLQTSPAAARLIWVGSSSFVSELGLRRLPEAAEDNLRLVERLVERALGRQQTLPPAQAGSFSRTLRPLSPAERRRFEWINEGLTALALLVLFLLHALLRRRARRPIPLEPRP